MSGLRLLSRVVRVIVVVKRALLFSDYGIGLLSTEIRSRLFLLLQACCRLLHGFDCPCFWLLLHRRLLGDGSCEGQVVDAVLAAEVLSDVGAHCLVYGLVKHDFQLFECVLAVVDHDETTVLVVESLQGRYELLKWDYLVLRGKFVLSEFGTRHTECVLDHDLIRGCWFRRRHTFLVVLQVLNRWRQGPSQSCVCFGLTLCRTLCRKSGLVIVRVRLWRLVRAMRDRSSGLGALSREHGLVKASFLLLLFLFFLLAPNHRVRRRVVADVAVAVLPF